MADRVSASITIGGKLPASLLDAFAEAVESEGLSTEWDGEPFDRHQIPGDGPLTLMAHEVAWGRFERLEAFCIAHGLPFSRWCGAYPCQWGAERTVFTGSGETQSYAVDEDDYTLMGRCTAERLGSYAAIIAHFDAADFPVPPLAVVPGKKETGDG